MTHFVVNPGNTASFVCFFSLLSFSLPSPFYLVYAVNETFGLDFGLETASKSTNNSFHAVAREK